MTFYEAAVEVLRRSGRPLHFKKITEVALRDELLSHVGKAPESTMEDRLDLETKKDDASWIVRTRPGVYMLKSEVAERLNEEAKARDEENRKKREETRAAKAELPVVEEEDEFEGDDSEAEDEDDEDDDEEGDEEEGDEEEGDEEEAEAAGDDGGSDEDRGSDEGGSRSRRRRRRRGGRRRSESGSEKTESAPSASAKTNGVASAAEAAKPAERSERPEKRGRRRGGRKEESTKQASFEGLDGERFESIGDAALAVLQANERKPMSASTVAEVVFEKKLVKFHTHDPEATIESALVTDNQVRARSGRRPLFAQYRDARWGLTEWGVSDAGIEKEQKILALAAELRQEAHDQLCDAVARLKPEAFDMVVMTLLQRLDYRNLKVSKRTSDGDTYFSADWRRGLSDLRVCVHVTSDAETTLKGGAIKDLRETLEHYSASEGVVVHIGEVSKDAVRESRKEDQEKVTIIDRKAFVSLLIDEGIGVQTFQTPLIMVDTAFIDALQR